MTISNITNSQRRKRLAVLQERMELKEQQIVGINYYRESFEAAKKAQEQRVREEQEKLQFLLDRQEASLPRIAELNSAIADIKKEIGVLTSPKVVQTIKLREQLARLQEQVKLEEMEEAVRGLDK